MTRDDIICMAREAMKHTSIEPNDKVTFYVAYNNGVDADGFCDSVETFIERFANLVAAAEREACAKVCEAEGERVDASWVSCAFAIRERGAMTNYNYEMQRQTLIDYLQLMVSRADWHGVSDAANDLRVLEAENRASDPDMAKVAGIWARP